jgi:hypothetical protein
MNKKLYIATVCLTILVAGCRQSPPIQSTDLAPASVANQPQTEFQSIIEGFLAECKSASVNSPRKMEERLGIAALGSREQGGEDPEKMDRSQWHPVLREIIECTHEKQPYETIKRTYVDKPSPQRQEAILLLKVMGYKCPETEAISD